MTQTTKIDWHPYPEEKPPEDAASGWYPITVRTCKMDIFSERWYRADHRDFGSVKGIGYITAWAYPIEPYRRKE